MPDDKSIPDLPKTPDANLTFGILGGLGAGYLGSKAYRGMRSYMRTRWEKIIEQSLSKNPKLAEKVAPTLLGRVGGWTKRNPIAAILAGVVGTHLLRNLLSGRAKTPIERTQGKTIIL